MLRVQHCVLSAVVRQYGPHPTSDLLGVDYFLTVPADTEFPRVMRPMELFVRFYGRDVPRTRLMVTVARAIPGQTVDVVYRLPFRLPAYAGRVTIDRSVKLSNIQLPGEGAYRIRLLRRIRRWLDPIPGWRVMATENFWVERAL